MWCEGVITRRHDFVGGKRSPPINESFKDNNKFPIAMSHKKSYLLVNYLTEMARLRSGGS